MLNPVVLARRQEIRGMAHGSGVPSSTLFLQNIGLEFGDAIGPKRLSADGCSDYQLCDKDVCLVGHNEDNDSSALNHTVLVKASFGNLTWEGFAYAGDLVSGAFGYNSNGNPNPNCHCSALLTPTPTAL